LQGEIVDVVAGSGGFESVSVMLRAFMSKNGVSLAVLNNLA